MMVSSSEVETLELGSKLNRYLYLIYFPFQLNDEVSERTS